MPAPKILISREQIARRVAEIGSEITRDFPGQPVVFVCVLKGAAIFLSDLARQVQLDATFDFIGAASYGSRPSPAQELDGTWDSTGEVRLTKDVDHSMKDKNVILVEDILDTGLTLNYLKKHLLSHQPKSLRIAVLLDKPSRRKQTLQADYVGFTIPDEFVVGYGLDSAERYLAVCGSGHSGKTPPARLAGGANLSAALVGESRRNDGTVAHAPRDHRRNAH